MPKPMAKCYITMIGSSKDHSVSQIGGWIVNLDGRFQTHITADTTHVVVHELPWNTHNGAVQRALELQAGEANFKMVSFDWLMDSIRNQTKKKEGPYLLKRPESEAAKGSVVSVRDVFNDGTEKFVDEVEKKRLDRRLEAEEKVRKQQEQAIKREEEGLYRQKRKEEAALFQEGSKSARREIFSSNHHIYVDATGFRYEVVLTKIDTRHNRNERYRLIIYESNAEPHTYAMSAHFTGTRTRPTNTILASIGCPFPTAFREFCREFQARTNVPWDERIAHAQLRAQNRAVKDPEPKIEEEFENKPFIYHPPAYGPMGRVPAELEEPQVRLLPSYGGDTLDSGDALDGVAVNPEMEALAQDTLEGNKYKDAGLDDIFAEPLIPYTSPSEHPTSLQLHDATNFDFAQSNCKPKNLAAQSAVGNGNRAADESKALGKHERTLSEDSALTEAKRVRFQDEEDLFYPA